MSALGVALIVGGLFFMASTIWHAKSEDDVRESERRERVRKEAYGVFANRPNQFEWTYRATYRHPILMRLPGVIFLTVGCALVLAESLR